MSIQGAPILAIIDSLNKYSIIPPETNTHDIGDEYALMDLIRKNTKSSRVKLTGGDIGTDDDAGEDYLALMKRFSKITNGDISYENMSSTTVNDQVNLHFTYDAKPYAWSFEQSSDSIASEFLDLMIGHSKNYPKGEFINLMDEDSIMIGYLPKDVVALLYAHDIVPEL
jgi:hypothetical protein